MTRSSPYARILISCALLAAFVLVYWWWSGYTHLVLPIVMAVVAGGSVMAHDYSNTRRVDVKLERPYVGSTTETDAMWPGVNAVDWLVPWHPIKDGPVDDGMSQELYSELSAHHELYGIQARPVGRRQDCDDVLFELLDGSGRFAVVHLTYAQHPEPDPFWPATEVYADWAQFERESMRPDAAEWGA
jgi:hypothetical protein